MTSALRLDPGFDDDPYDGPYDEQGAAPDLDPGLRHVVAAPYEHAEPVRRVRRGRVRRQPVTQTRTHGGVAARSTDVRNVRPMVRATAGVVISAPPPLRVVPTRRRAARLVGLGFAVVFVLMVGAAAFQTQLARRQVELDKIDRSIRDANEDYSRLRQQRAELRAPGHLAEEAAKLGMKPGDRTTFQALDPDVVAEVQRSAGGVFDEHRTDVAAIDEYAAVKQIVGAAP